ncbi:DUF3822 family protein [Sphingobacterium sp. SRCM116780]|uniref:DUF3822 family protein n=1 Tax=Sphingobacterium sp. SRCM116780 TaxID=2907623 RepID=UPI001F1A20C7|nr:DUF3822 family protein [Sphingobacterium sp. SRCM116780]UIR57585.1 DUF3822 family protein [Sphingobacterium sp. SRCM116780]
MNYISEEFNIHFLPEYTLSAKAGFSKDVIMVTDKQLNLNLLLEYDAENPRLEATQILSLPFRYVKVVIPHQSLTFIPKEVFQEDRLNEYASYLVEHVPHHIHTQELKNLGIVAVFEYDLILYNRWKALFPDAEIFPEFCIVLDQAQDLVPIRGSVLGVHFVSDHLVDLYVFQNGQFILYNSFDVHFTDDLNYYILNILKQLSLTDQVSKVLVSGDIPHDSYIKCLERYSSTIAYLESKSKVYVRSAEQINFNNYQTLLDAVLCE